MNSYSKEVMQEMIAFMKASKGMCNSPTIKSLEDEINRREELDLVEVSGKAHRTWHGRQWGYLTKHIIINGQKVEPSATTPQLAETKGKDTILMPRSEALERGLLEEEEEEREICPYCNGTNISPYERDGGSCPHCFGGYLK